MQVLDMKKILTAIAAPLLLITCLYGGCQILENRTQDKVLAIIASAQPGHPISEVIARFGQPSLHTDDVERMGNGGAPVNPTFCQGKTLHQYYVSPPCRWVNIYTDKNGIILFVNWSRS